MARNNRRMRLTLLSGGFLNVNRGMIHPGDSTRRRVTLPVMMVLIEHEGRRVLVDTGMPPMSAGDGEAMRREYGWNPTRIRAAVAADERVDLQLAKIGLRPLDVDLIICTHFHTDHEI